MKDKLEQLKLWLKRCWLHLNRQRNVRSTKRDMVAWLSVKRYPPLPLDRRLALNRELDRLEERAHALNITWPSEATAKQKQRRDGNP